MNVFLRNLRLLFIIAGMMLAIHLINITTGYALMQLGLYPRHIASLPYVFTTPFLHADLYHLANNVVGIFLFGSISLARSKRFFVRSSLFIITLGGLLVWLFGRPAIHIGASGWVFGLWAIAIVMGFVERRFASILISILVIVLYGGMIYGVLPGDPWVSFEAHFFGALAGIIYVFYIYKR